MEKNIMQGNEVISSTSRQALYNQGFETGYSQAADDYSTGKVEFEVFETTKSIIELLDFYGVGYEMGYLRKVAEILSN